MEVPNPTLRRMRRKFSTLKTALLRIAAELPIPAYNEINTAISGLELELFGFEVPPEREYAIAPVEGGWQILVYVGNGWGALNNTVYPNALNAANAIPGIETDPEYPQWVQPTGAHDAYGAGARVTYNSRNWESNVDGNVWEPGASGSEMVWKGLFH